MKNGKKQKHNFLEDENEEGSAESANPQHELRKKEAKRQAKRKDAEPEVIKTIYYYLKGNTYNEKKGHKVVRETLTVNGSTRDFIGWSRNKNVAPLIKQWKAEKVFFENKPDKSE